MAALQALEDDNFFFAGLFSLPDWEPFNHWGIALFADHGCLLPQMIPTNRDILAAFALAFGTLIGLLLEFGGCRDCALISPTREEQPSTFIVNAQHRMHR
jgi:hypothetical protein